MGSAEKKQKNKRKKRWKNKHKKYSTNKLAWQQNVPIPFFQILYHG
jgi:hypothetical protein